jgi:hypothetical protein
MGSRYVDPSFLNLGATCSFAPLPLYPPGKSPGTHWVGGWVEPQSLSGRYGEVNILDPSNPIASIAKIIPKFPNASFLPLS